MPNETEQTILIGQSYDNLYRDRYAYERDTLQAEAVRACHHFKEVAMKKKISDAPKTDCVIRRRRS